VKNFTDSKFVHPFSTHDGAYFVYISTYINNFSLFFHNLKKFCAFYQSNLPPDVQKEIGKNIPFGTEFMVAKKRKKFLESVKHSALKTLSKMPVC
jgi:hypothetical protein